MMKKIISILLLLCVVGCEIRPMRNYEKPTTYYYPTTVVTEHCGYDPYPYPLEWADYCVGDCCAWETYDGMWTCQETWCYDYSVCEWDVTEVCF